MLENLTTIILRFRDLVTATGQTIEQHRRICSERGFVYWGWWNKSGETIPDNAFRILHAIAESEERLQLFLLDSGTHRLYSAKCSSIEWRPTHVEFLSPEPNQTPEYYRERGYLAWFKLVDIRTTLLNESVLHDFSYLQVSDFYRSGESHYIPFYNKRVMSSRELVQQNRTIWFLRPYNAQGDASNEVSLLDSQFLQPSHFSKKYMQTESKNILWISDPHYNDQGHHGFPLESNAQEQNMALSIENTLSNIHIKDMGAMIISGDLTWRATREEFEMANSLIKWGHSWGKLNNYEFLICPGNHDITFSEALVAPGNPSPIGVSHPQSRAAYEEFYQNLYYIRPNQYLSLGRKFLVEGAIPVDIAVLNSNLLEQRKEVFQGYGFVGRDQMEHAANEMGWDAERGADYPTPFRIVVLHHHLIPVTYTERAYEEARYSITLDAEAMQRWIVKYKINLVLHGHMHQPFYTKITRTQTFEENDLHEFYVVGMGSAGVKAGHIGEVGKNTFGILSFDKNGVNIRVQTIDAIVDQSRELFNLHIPHNRS